MRIVCALRRVALPLNLAALWLYLILGKAYAPTIWLALAVKFAGMYLVQSRPKVALAVALAIGENTR